MTRIKESINMAIANMSGRPNLAMIDYVARSVVTGFGNKPLCDSYYIVV